MVGNRFLYLFEKLTIKRLIVSFFLTVLAFSIIYYGLSKIQNGIILTFAGTKSPTFFDCIYFSIITISSLGYGDMRPIGVSRIFASLQVLIGLAYLGLIIARLSSVKQDFYVREIYIDQERQRVMRFSDSYLSMLNDFKRIFENFPTSSNIDTISQDKDILLKELKTIEQRFRSMNKSLIRYFHYGITYGEILDDVTPKTINILLKNISSILIYFNNLSDLNKSLLSNTIGKSDLNHSLKNIYHIMKFIDANSTDISTKKRCGVLDHIIKTSNKKYDL